MPSPTHRYVTLVDTEIHYTEWGDPDATPLVCVHGLSRTGRDFDPLAEALSDEFRVLCPDMPGRGESEWDPEMYDPESLGAVVVAFFEALELEAANYLGLSMGGQLGIGLVPGPLSDRVNNLVLVDVGPDPADDDAADEGIDRIVEYLTDPPTFDRFSDLEAYFRDVYDTFSPMTDAEWRNLARTSARRTDDGQFTPNYDTRIVEPLLAADTDTDQWALFDAIDQPVMVVRGAESDILATETFERMQERKPDMETVTVDCGHAPALNVPEQTEPIRNFLS
ncbi:alpha/beta fold hydrolase [Halorarius halobius]|uniref:alpha/beta fold hydrolase n=1 Tax=Halorarius halobius TaxID=2962671 RepID=UPI0020CD1CC4|nr:alpha/beta hydrolase [Halorarius halobius]